LFTKKASWATLNSKQFTGSPLIFSRGHPLPDPLPPSIGNQEINFQKVPIQKSNRFHENRQPLHFEGVPEDDRALSGHLRFYLFSG
jgi:hypothetical protein